MSSKRHIRRRSCENKVRYATWEIAERAAFDAEKRCTTGIEIGVYKCDLGNHWHLRRDNKHMQVPHAAKMA